jgi:PKD repeat protein
MRIRCLLHLALAPAIGLAGFAWSPAEAQDAPPAGCVVDPVKCPLGYQKCPLPPALTDAPTGSPVAASLAGPYFEAYATGPVPMLGQSYDYLCHVCQPTRDNTSLNTTNDARCTLNTFASLFGNMRINSNNVIRVETIFNHSPGHSVPPCCAPFQNEQPYTRSGGKWDLRKPLNGQYFIDLETIVNAAAKDNIFVEVTLFNPWDGDWHTGPFNPSNTLRVNGHLQGFTNPKYFASFEDRVNHADVQQQNIDARTAQKNAVVAVVTQLKKYSNVIWEVANEPDFIPSYATNPDPPPGNVPGIIQADVFAWEQWVIAQIVATDPGSNGGASHMIQVNGHYKDPVTHLTTFAWEPNGTQPTANAESAHYAFNNTDPNANPTSGLFGAIELMRATDPSIVTGRASTPVGFNEDIPVPDVLHSSDSRSDDAVRAEAWEFMMHGGARFDGYSLDYQDPSAAKVSQELGFLANLLMPNDTVGLDFFDRMKPVDCNSSGAWCSGITWGQTDMGACTSPPSNANLYYSTIQESDVVGGEPIGDYLLYVHHGTRLNFNHDGYKAIPCTSPGTTPGYKLGATGAPPFQYSVPLTGCYQEYWQDPATGLALAYTRGKRTANISAPPMATPAFRDDVVLFVQLLFPGSCASEPPLTASFSISCTHLQCTANAGTSTPSAAITNYSWNWGDGTTTNAGTSATSGHTFPKNGSYVVTLQVSDSADPEDVSFSSKQVSVSRRGGHASFAATCNQLSCTFDGSGSAPGDAPPLVMYSWTFGDASGAANATDSGASYTYAGGGSYTVALTVTDSDGVMASTFQTVTVAGPPIASFVSNCSELTCAFDASGSTGDSTIVSYAWTFGDGTTGSGVAPSHTYVAGGDFTVVLTVTDANGQSGTATGSVTVDAPPTPGFTVACVNRTCTVHSTATDSDSTPIAVWQWNWGDGSPTITPTSPYPWADQTYTYATSGRYTITLTVTDTAGLSSSLQLAVLADTAPVAANDTATTERDLPVTINVLGNDTDADGDPLSIASVNLQSYPGASWQVVPSGSSWALKVTPPDSFVGTMTFTYVAADPWGLSSTATVTLTVTQWSVVVDALGEQFYCPQNGSVRIPLATLLANDYDSAGQTLTIVAFDTSHLMGTLDCTTDPTACTYTPPVNAYGYTYFTYTVSDPVGRKDTATVRIYIGNYGQAPTAKDVFFTTTMNAPKTFTIQDVVQNDPDTDGDTITMGLQSGATAFGSLSCTTPMYSCTYTPNTGYVGTDRFSYTASDGINPAATATINILTLPLTTPTFDVREDVIVTGVNQSAYFSNGLLTNDYAPSGGPITVTALNTTGLIGTLSCNATSCTYYPPSYFQGTTTFKYTATDGHGATDTAIVKIKVGVTNNPPVAVPQTLSTPKNTTLRFSVFQLMQGAYDPDDDPLSVTVYTVTAHLGTLSCGTPNYWCTYTPNANTTGADVISYALSDGTTYVTSNVTINITP